MTEEYNAGENMNKNYLMFDMDGTLLDSMHAWVLSGPEYAEQVLGEKNSRISDEFARLSVKKALYSLAEVAGSDNVSLDGFCKVLLNHYLTDCSVKPGVVEFLEMQKAKGAHMCVITATPKIAAIPALEHLGLIDYFDFIITYDDFPSGKDKPDIFFEACKRFGCEISDAAMFEDALYSIKTSTSIGIYTVGVPEKIYKSDEDTLINTADLFLHNGFTDLL